MQTAVARLPLQHDDVAGPQPAITHRTAPPVRAVVVRVAVILSIACVAPALLFSATLMAFGITAAVFVALSWTCGAIGWRWATKRPVSGVLMLSVTIMTVRTGFILATGNTFVYFIQPVFTDVAVATIFLTSLLTARPLVARLAPDFYPMNDDLAARPRVRRLFWRLTLMWGLVVLAKGSVTLWLLLSQSVVDFVLIKNAVVISITSLSTAATIWLSVQVARREGLLAAT
jgi:hypothetical protein